MSEAGFRCGYAAIVGRPNVGKSTLLNALLGEKISIVTDKPQTTRHRILGILTEQDTQVVFVDTPGLHSGARGAMNKLMNRVAAGAIVDADVVLFMIEALKWERQDARVLERISEAKAPVFLLINKIDRVKPKQRLLAFIDELAQRHAFGEIIPISARQGDNLEVLKHSLVERLPESPPLFPQAQRTDRGVEFRAAEIIREQLTSRLHHELPYGLTVEIQSFDSSASRCLIDAVIWVERPGQKRIVIGQGGQLLKAVGRAARLQLVEILNQPVHLELWVKVKRNWSQSERDLNALGFDIP